MVIAEHEDHIVKIKSSELRKLLCQWQELRSRNPRPPKIKITEMRGVFNMEAME